MTEQELLLDDIVNALNRLTLAIVALVAVLIVLSWSLDEMALRVSLFGILIRRLTPHHAADEASPSPPIPPVKPATLPSDVPAAKPAAKDVR